MSDEIPVFHTHPRPRGVRPSLSVADLIGARYAEGGTDKRLGLDCWGLARIVLARLDVALPATPAEALAEARTVAFEVRDAAREGDLLVMECEGRPHVGVCLNATSFIHATKAGGVALARVADWAAATRRRLRFVALATQLELEALRS